MYYLYGQNRHRSVVSLRENRFLRFSFEQNADAQEKQVKAKNSTEFFQSNEKRVEDMVAKASHVIEETGAKLQASQKTITDVDEFTFRLAEAPRRRAEAIIKSINGIRFPMGPPERERPVPPVRPEPPQDPGAPPIKAYYSGLSNAGTQYRRELSEYQGSKAYFEKLVKEYPLRLKEFADLERAYPEERKKYAELLKKDRAQSEMDQEIAKKATQDIQKLVAQLCEFGEVALELSLSEWAKAVQDQNIRGIDAYTKVLVALLPRYPQYWQLVLESIVNLEDDGDTLKGLESLLSGLPQESARELSRLITHDVDDHLPSLSPQLESLLSEANESRALQVRSMLSRLQVVPQSQIDSYHEIVEGAARGAWRQQPDMINPEIRRGLVDALMANPPNAQRIQLALAAINGELSSIPDTQRRSQAARFLLVVPSGRENERFQGIRRIAYSNDFLASANDGTIRLDPLPENARDSRQFAELSLQFLLDQDDPEMRERAISALASSLPQATSIRGARERATEVLLSNVSGRLVLNNLFASNRPESLRTAAFEGLRNFLQLTVARKPRVQPGLLTAAIPMLQRAMRDPQNNIRWFGLEALHDALSIDAYMKAEDKDHRYEVFPLSEEFRVDLLALLANPGASRVVREKATEILEILGSPENARLRLHRPEQE